MEFKIYDKFETLAGYQDEWNSLLQNSISHVPFLTYEYLRSWWETRGGGEWPDDSRLALIAAFEGDRLIGIAPLFHAVNLSGEPALMFVGAVEVSDFLDFIVSEENLPVFLSGLFDFILKDASLPARNLIDLYNILEDSPSLDALKLEAEKRGWEMQQSHLQPSPFITLSGDFEDYLAGIDKKQRHEIRRKLRNLDSSPVEGAFYIVEKVDELQAEVDAFLDMMAQDPSKQAFLTPPMRRHIHNTAGAAFDNGWLQLGFFTIDGKKAAASMNFLFDDRLWLYNSGWAWEYREFSPGWVHLAHQIQWGIENGIREFDFMRGDEDYKYKFGGVDRHIFRVTLTP
jgi:CelD/BcsL family acetyltransferase involved in cellulose biosynthesis